VQGVRGAREVKAALVGSPNVGKSVVFNRLTGAYATVSNYPGTTVEVARGYAKSDGRVMEIVDTPGMYSLASITGEEKVTRAFLMAERPETVVHVLDARAMERMLGLSLQLAEAGLPLVVDLNIMDEAEKSGLRIDAARLETLLGVPVVKTAGALGRGIAELQQSLSRARPADPDRAPVRYDASIERALAKLAPLLPADPGLSRRAIGLLLLQEDPDMAALVAADGSGNAGAIESVVAELRVKCPSPALAISNRRQARVRELMAGCFDDTGSREPRLRESLSRITINPLTGIPLLLAVLYFGLYQFVGRFGAGYLVDLLERVVFGQWLLPPLVALVDRLLPWQAARDLLVGSFGILTLGVRYAIAIILPIVGTFFLAFSLLEDSGYLPRLALLVDRAFKLVGLSGRAVVPMVLGFGCDTMATVVARTLETRREQVIATLLLALAIPCSAQLGVILALLSAHPAALAAWAVSVLAIFVVVGALSSRILPGERPSFAMELPPLRVPRPANVLVKTFTRMRWYLVEIIPVFLLVSAALWLGQITGFFPILISWMSPVMRLMGLPADVGGAFLMGFFRRDYGAAGLYDLVRAGTLGVRQLTVASITLTLFLPCVAQVAVMVKERGWKTAGAIVGFILPVAFLAGWAANALLDLGGMR
jgi:ferrous iron transport protein B